MIVKTSYGSVSGRAVGKMTAFLGIPYAKVPVGALRFRPPEPPEAWTGVLEAVNYGARCPQPQTPKYHGHNYVGDYADGPADSEDCLKLNIWTSGFDGAKRPVIVMIHGGGSFIGSARSDFTDGPHFCGGRDAVFVTFNYRLGPFGFLYLGELLGADYETSGSLGLMDQVAALHWVKENISVFGGDPENITIMGQSAGGKSVANLIVTPQAKGLFKRCIMESGAIQCLRDRRTAGLITRKLLEYYGIAPENAKKLLTLPASTLVDGFYRYTQDYPQVVGPTLDAVNFPLLPEQALEIGLARGLDILIGYNRFERGLLPCKSEPLSVRETYLTRRYGKNAPHILEVYRQYRKTMPEYEAWQTLLTQYHFAQASKKYACMLAEHGARVWCYRWDLFDEAPPVHCAELRYIYRYSDREGPDGYRAAYEGMSRLMNAAWNQFAACGDPRVPELKEWKPYTNAANGTRMYFSQTPLAESYDLHGYDPEFVMQEIVL